MKKWKYDWLSLEFNGRDAKKLNGTGAADNVNLCETQAFDSIKYHIAKILNFMAQS